MAKNFNLDSLQKAVQTLYNNYSDRSNAEPRDIVIRIIDDYEDLIEESKVYEYVIYKALADLVTELKNFDDKEKLVEELFDFSEEINSEMTPEERDELTKFRPLAMA